MKVLIFAYACEPGKGSEPGVGWNISRELSRLHDVAVITRTNNREAIESALASDDCPGPRFEYVDLPRWARTLKRGQRGVRLYYMLWQLAAAKRGRQLHRRSNFDIVHHLTFANFWLPTMAWAVPAPFVWGPVGGGVGAPWRLSRVFGIRGIAYEVMRAAARSSGRFLNPFVRASWRRAAVVLVQNPETGKRIPRRYRNKTVVAFNGGLASNEISAAVRDRPLVPTFVFAGRMLAWKGASLCIRALAQAESPTCRVVFVGDGPDKERCRSLAKRLGVEDRVVFRGWLSREEALRVMDGASGLLLPSLHDDSPLVIAEALGRGIPVIGIRRGGPPILVGEAGTCVEVGSLRDVVSGLVRALASCASDPTLSTKALARAHELRWQAKAELISGIYATCLQGADYRADVLA